MLSRSSTTNAILPVAGADLVGLLLVVVEGQLEPGPVAFMAHVDVHRLVSDRQAMVLQQTELLVEVDRLVEGQRRGNRYGSGRT